MTVRMGEKTTQGPIVFRIVAADSLGVNGANQAVARFPGTLMPELLIEEMAEALIRLRIT